MKRFNHPKLGPFDLEFAVFQVAEQPSLRLFLYVPTDASTEKKLRSAAV